MPDGLTITYKGNTLHSSTEDDTFTLNTSGKYMEDNITISATNVSSLDVTYNNNSLVSEISATGTWTLNTAGKLMEADVNFDVVVTPPPYITFSSAETFTLSASKGWTGTLEYSLDTTSWTTWTGSATPSSTVLYLRGTGNTRISSGSSYRFVLNGSKWIYCAGNIENLLDYATVQNGNHPTMVADCFHSLFSDNTQLRSAPTLPATSLSTRCYYEMFKNTRITKTPKLPALTLAQECYRMMFYQCSALTTPPELPATTLAVGCYLSMFNSCSSLITAPDLPATSLQNQCYTSMFTGCSSLLNIPYLSATVVPLAAYDSMFDNCSLLTGSIDLRHVTSFGAINTGAKPTITTSNIIAHGTAGISVLFGTNLITIGDDAFNDGIGIPDGGTSVNNYFYFTDNDSPAFDSTLLVWVGSSKGTITNNIYTDNTTIKNAVLTKVDEYTIVNVYHLDGSDW